MAAAPLLMAFVIGAAVGLAGDACHVLSGTTSYAASARQWAWQAMLVTC